MKIKCETTILWSFCAVQSFRMINFGWTLLSLPFLLFFDHKFLCDVRNYGIPMSDWTMNMAKNTPINLSHQPWLVRGFSRTNETYSPSLNQLSIDQNTHSHIKYFRRITIILFIHLYIASIRFDLIRLIANFTCKHRSREGKPTPNATCFQMTNNFISALTKWFDDSF